MSLSSQKSQILVAAGQKEGGGLPVAIGVPFAQGELKDARDVRVRAPDGKLRPAAGRALATWPDGSTRWCLVSMLSGEKGSHEVFADRATASPAPQKPVRLTREGDDVTLDNGLLRVSLAASGAGPIRKVTANGHDYLARAQDLRFVINTFDTTHEKSPRTIRVIEESNIRARVRVEGAHFDPSGKRLLNYRLDVEVWAGVPVLRFDYHFFNLERGRDDQDIDRIAIEFDLNLDKAKTHRHVHQNYWTVHYLPREVKNPAPVAIVADDTRHPTHVEDPAMLLDEEEYNFHVRPPLVDTQDWMGIGDSQRSVYVRMQDFAAMRPKRLASNGNRVDLEIWPARAGRLKLPQGRSRRQVVTLAFASKPQLDPGEAASLLNVPLWEGRANVDPQLLRRLAVFDQDRVMAVGANIRFEKFLRRLVNPMTPQSMFDLGDTPDSGYLSTYIPIGAAQQLKPGAPKMPRVFSAGPHGAFAPWAMPQFYEPVWTNNEYDLIHALATEVMRTGRGDLWTMLRWVARHNIEVDFVHLSDHKQQNRSTPQHSANHNRSGSIPSHFWTQGLLEYHCLTGDIDALEVATALGDKIIEDFADPKLRPGLWGFTRELGWPALALEHLCDLFREPRFEKQLTEVVDFFVSYDRGGFSGKLNLSSGDARHGLARQMIQGFFAYACMVEAVDHYVRRTGRKEVEKWLLDLLDDLHKALDGAHRDGEPHGITNMHPLAMAMGYERTGDAKYVRLGMVALEELIESQIWINCPPECKHIAMSHRGLVRFLHHAAESGRLKELEFRNA